MFARRVTALAHVCVLCPQGARVPGANAAVAALAPTAPAERRAVPAVPRTSNRRNLLSGKPVEYATQLTSATEHVW
jgi:hypothetical protein